MSVNNIEKYYDIPVKTINFVVKDEYELAMFYICVNSFYDDIINLKLNVNVETKEDMVESIKGLKMNSGVVLNVSTKIEEDGLWIANNCIAFPNSLKELTSDTIVEITPKYMEELFDKMEKECIIPKKILVFKESEILKKEQIPYLMRVLYSSMLKSIHVAECILDEIENRLKGKQE